MNQSVKPPEPNPGVLAMPAWLRMVLVLPLLAMLWLGVWWASLEVAPL